MNQITIKKTHNYDLFKSIEFNRPICQKNLDKLISLNKNKSRFHLFPIVIDSHFNIIDGQHRFEACKKLGNAIHYLVDDTLENHWQSITEVNQAGKKHTTGDVYEMLLRSNDPYALMIKTVHDAYNFIAPSQLCMYFINNGRKDKTVLRKMQNKEHKILNFESKLALLKAFIEKYDYYRAGHVQTTFTMMRKVGENDACQFIDHLYSKGFIPKKTWAVFTYKEEIIKHYNKGKHKNRVQSY